ncbi:hypothetical protein QAD02_002790 [Eretmocerus hayati]|uniref:Uncharacterized protein n=1 Tax=Eretmocerus hayati TaxID=131215 RepID=A0ACC2NLM8_9HYME|nr:hypothetical protein QAD02_002790 [Eretmocerus hayati]
MPLFDVCDVTRQKKSLNPLNDSCLSVQNLITKASGKLRIEGKYLVSEKTGSPVDEDDISREIQRGEMLMLLKDGETWLQQMEFQELITISTTLPATSSSADPLRDREDNSNQQSNQEEMTEDPEVDQSSNPNSENTQNSSNQENINFEDFIIPWQKLDSETLRELRQGVRSDEVTKMTVDLVIAELRFINLHVPSEVLRKVAKQMINQVS